LEGHYNIIEVDPNTGEPLLPKANTRKFINQCGVVVRDMSRSKSVNGKRGRIIVRSLFVSDIEKRLFWEAITKHFTLPEGVDVELVKKLGSQEDGHTIPDLEEEAVQ
jgi:hypothetical protein